MPNTETLAPNQGQNRSRARPLRSASSMVPRPLTSIPPLPAACAVELGGSEPPAEGPVTVLVMA